MFSLGFFELYCAGNDSLGAGKMLLGRLRMKTECSTSTALCHRTAREAAPFSRLHKCSMNFAMQWRARCVRAAGAREEEHQSRGSAARRAAEHAAHFVRAPDEQPRLSGAKKRASSDARPFLAGEKTI